jgi:uridine phosphorylase
MWSFPLAGREVGIVGCAVGAPFAVLVAEQMVASGARGIISLTSAGRIAIDLPEGAHFMLIDRALRDEGTSYHYLPPDAPFVAAPPNLLEPAARALRDAGIAAHTGPSWTTDAPYRETETAINHARGMGARVVEMEAAALYAFARARGASVLCIAHVTNAMAQMEGDFEKGEADGTEDALRALGAVVRGWPGGG